MADEIVVTIYPLQSGAMRVEAWLNTRGQTRTLALALAVIAALIGLTVLGAGECAHTAR